MNRAVKQTYIIRLAQVPFNINIIDIMNSTFLSYCKILFKM